jgi:hypothetical protein
VVITPSLLRKWKAEEKPREGKWTYDIPVRVSQEDVKSLFEYIHSRLQEYNIEYDMRNERIKQVEMETSEAVQKRMSFTSLVGGGVSGFISHNEIVASKVKGSEIYTLSLACDVGNALGEKHVAYKIATSMRAIILEWSTMKK